MQSWAYITSCQGTSGRAPSHHAAPGCAFCRVDLRTQSILPRMMLTSFMGNRFFKLECLFIEHSNCSSYRTTVKGQGICQWKFPQDFKLSSEHLLGKHQITADWGHLKGQHQSYFTKTWWVIFPLKLLDVLAIVLCVEWVQYLKRGRELIANSC